MADLSHSDWATPPVHAGEFADLCERLSGLEQQSQGAPLLCVVEGQDEPDWAVEREIDSPLSPSSPSKSVASPRDQHGGDWEFL